MMGPRTRLRRAKAYYKKARSEWMRLDMGLLLWRIYVLGHAIMGFLVVAFILVLVSAVWVAVLSWSVR